MPSGLPPRPAGVVFGIRVDGVPTGIGVSSIETAEHQARGVLEKVGAGRTVEVFDRVTGETVKAIS
jgi:hypothetical protein